MPAFELGGLTLSLREGIMVLIVCVAAYILFVLLRMRRLDKPPVTPAVPLPPPEEDSASAAMKAQNQQPEAVEKWETVSDGLANEVLRHGLEQELVQLREEVDAMRGELAALRQDMQQELGHLRATQTVSPIYGDAMQLAASGYDAAAIAERCGIARAEAELVVALSKSQEH